MTEFHTDSGSDDTSSGFGASSVYIINLINSMTSHVLENQFNKSISPLHENNRDTTKPTNHKSHLYTITLTTWLQPQSRIAIVIQKERRRRAGSYFLLRGLAIFFFTSPSSAESMAFNRDIRACFSAVNAASAVCTRAVLMLVRKVSAPLRSELSGSRDDDSEPSCDRADSLRCVSGLCAYAAAHSQLVH
jgi:hypothetical protein